MTFLLAIFKYDHRFENFFSFLAYSLTYACTFHAWTSLALAIDNKHMYSFLS